MTVPFHSSKLSDSNPEFLQFADAVSKNAPLRTLKLLWSAAEDDIRAGFPTDGVSATNTPLHYACTRGDAAVIRWLLTVVRHPLAVRVKGRGGGSPLCAALRAGHVDAAMAVLDACPTPGAARALVTGKDVGTVLRRTGLKLLRAECDRGAAGIQRLVSLLQMDIRQSTKNRVLASMSPADKPVVQAALVAFGAVTRPLRQNAQSPARLGRMAFVDTVQAVSRLVVLRACAGGGGGMCVEPQCAFPCCNSFTYVHLRAGGPAGAALAQRHAIRRCPTSDVVFRHNAASATAAGHQSAQKRNTLPVACACACFLAPLTFDA